MKCGNVGMEMVVSKIKLTFRRGFSGEGLTVRSYSVWCEGEVLFQNSFVCNCLLCLF